MKPMRVAIASLAILLGGCGKVAQLQPPAGKPLPVRPLMARTTPTPDELLAAPQYARPNRVDELVKRSEPRKPDPFDLPPPVGGAAPTLPVGTGPQAVSNQTGPATPQ